MISQNKEEFEYCNIPIWWDKGYTGKDVKIGVFDSGANKDLPFFDGKVFDPLGTEHTDKLNKHGQKVIDVIHQIAPDAEIYMLNPSFSPKPEPQDKREALKWAIQNNIQLVNMSMKGTNANDIVKLEKQLYNNGTFLVTSAGNEGKRGLGTSAKQEHWFSVGAVHYNDSTGKITRAKYSSYGDEELDIMCFSNIYIHDGRNPQRVFSMEGTSFSSPFVVGMLALYYQYFKETNGRFPTPEETKEFILKNCIDLEQEGFDVYTGHGLFVLPNKVQKGSGKVNKPEKIIIHHSLTGDNKILEDFNAIKRYHMQVNGWDNIGYHWVLEKVGGKYHWIPGRDEKEVGAHCKEQGMNYKSIGICVVGNFDKEIPSEEIYKLVAAKCNEIRKCYPNIGIEDIEPHNKYATYKSCPGKNFDIGKVKKYMEEQESYVGKKVNREIPIVLDGKELDAKAIVIEMPDGGHSFGHIRKVFEALGFKVGYDGRVLLKSPKGWE